MRGISLRSRLASAVLVRDLWVVRYSLPAGLVVLGVEFLFLIKADKLGKAKATKISANTLAVVISTPLKVLLPFCCSTQWHRINGVPSERRRSFSILDL